MLNFIKNLFRKNKDLNLKSVQVETADGGILDSNNMPDAEAEAFIKINELADYMEKNKIPYSFSYLETSGNFNCIDHFKHRTFNLEKSSKLMVGGAIKRMEYFFPGHKFVLLNKKSLKELKDKLAENGVELDISDLENSLGGDFEDIDKKNFEE